MEKNKIILDCSSNEGMSHFECKYLIGCDGASSSVRKLLKIERDDLGYDQDWLVADAHLTQTTDIPRHHAKQICTIVFDRPARANSKKHRNPVFDCQRHHTHPMIRVLMRQQNGI